MGKLRTKIPPPLNALRLRCSHFSVPKPVKLSSLSYCPLHSDSSSSSLQLKEQYSEKKQVRLKRFPITSTVTSLCFFLLTAHQIIETLWPGFYLDWLDRFICDPVFIQSDPTFLFETRPYNLLLCLLVAPAAWFASASLFYLLFAQSKT